MEFSITVFVIVPFLELVACQLVIHVQLRLVENHNRFRENREAFGVRVAIKDAIKSFFLYCLPTVGLAWLASLLAVGHEFGKLVEIVSPVAAMVLFFGLMCLAIIDKRLLAVALLDICGMCGLWHFAEILTNAILNWYYG